MTRITGDAVVRALKELRCSVSVGDIALQLETTDTRAIATAARKPAADGRIKMHFPIRNGPAIYRFVRLTPKKA